MEAILIVDDDESICAMLKETLASPVVAGAFGDLPSLDELERRYLIHVLDAAGGNRTRAADILKIDRRTLYRMVARFGIDIAAEGEEAPKGGSQI